MYMDTLLHDLLDYSRLTRTELEPTPVTLEALLNEILASSAKDLEEKKAKVELKRPLLPVCAHLPTLRQILSNLVSNAIKFVEEGKAPHVWISTELHDSTVRIWIVDNGIGISEEHHQRIFNLFERLHTSQDYPGTGVGLALVRKGIERMGGRFGVDSSPGDGSRFWIELPAA
jgi:signal transduction histidine kinase